MVRTLIIAEAGVNHNGDLETAKKLVDVAVESKVDFVKFQLGIPELLVSRNAEKAEYQKMTTGEKESQLEMIKKISLSYDEHVELKKYCEAKNIKYLCTPFDITTVHFLDAFKMNFWKIPSGEITNYPYLKEIAKTRKPVVMSTGMSTENEIKDAILVLCNNGISKDMITLLHCNTEYPTPMEDVNLMAMLTLKKIFGVNIGYSDHTKGIEVPIAAVALGAKVIEKHFTLDRNMEGPDHKASLEPNELKNMVSSIRNIEKALGDGSKHISNSERKNIQVARKSIVAGCNIHKGDFFTDENLLVKRPGTGISPMMWNYVVGKQAKRDFLEDELIEL